MIAFKGVVSRETCLAFWKYDFSEGMRKELCRAVQTAFLDVLFLFPNTLENSVFGNIFF